MSQGILNSSKDVEKKVLDSSVYDARPLLFGNKILVIYKNKTRKRIPVSSIWGYENRFNQRFRIWKGRFCLFGDTGNFSTYLVKEGKYSHYYFSLGSDGDIYLLNRKNLHKLFNDNQCFIQKVDNYCKSIFKSCEDFDRKEKRLVVKELYSGC